MSGSGRDNFTPVAGTIPFDNSTNGFVADDTQAAIEEVFNNALKSASSGLSFGRSGNVTPGTYLQNETVPSNISGRWVYVNTAVVNTVFISNQLTTTYKVEVLYHDGNGAGLTSLGTVTVTAAKGGRFLVNWPVPTNKQIAVRMATDTPNSAKNVVCGLKLSGSI